MANEFLNVPVLPGNPVDKKSHTHLSIVFIVVAIIIIAVLLSFYFGLFGVATPTPVVNTPVVDNRAQMTAEALSKLQGAQPATPAEIKSALNQLSGAKSLKITQQQINQALSQSGAK